MTKHGNRTIKTAMAMHDTKETRAVRMPGVLAVLLFSLLTLAVGASTARAGEARVAAAANFTDAAQEIGRLFEAKTGHTVIFSFASTGTLYAQISHDAPFDVFLAADQERPRRAEAEGLAVRGSRFTYATGRIALYSADAGLVTGGETLDRASIGKIAIANPLTAPYGTAAVQAMNGLGVYDRLRDRIVRGNNIAQTYQFVQTGNAEIGFVALSQVVRHEKGSRWRVSDDLHEAIAQDAVLLKRGADKAAARAFLAFLKGPEADAVKAEYGYGAGNGETE